MNVCLRIINLRSVVYPWMKCLSSVCCYPQLSSESCSPKPAVLFDAWRHAILIPLKRKILESCPLQFRVVDLTEMSLDIRRLFGSMLLSLLTWKKRALNTYVWSWNIYFLLSVLDSGDSSSDKSEETVPLTGTTTLFKLTSVHVHVFKIRNNEMTPIAHISRMNDVIGHES